MEPTDLTEVLKGFDNKWIILSRDNTEVLASADKLLDLPKELFSEGFVVYVPDSRYSQTF
jgi:hypothetical protein